MTSLRPKIACWDTDRTRAISRRSFWIAAGALIASPGARAQGAASFATFLEGLWPKAKSQGVSRVTFDAALSGLAPDPALMGAPKQSEFERAIKAYIDDAASPARVARGREMRARWADQLDRVSHVEGVPREIILAVWGMETDFGRASAGDHDVLRSLATMAYARHDDTYADEVVAALMMLEKRLAAREKLKGSWAGAMGQPQFLPSAYLKYGVSFAGSGAPDIWNSIPDSLASIGRFLHKEGWQGGLAWGCETVIPKGFDWLSLTGGFHDFSARGFVRPGGGALPDAGEATLYLPAGAGGPAFLLSKNYWTIKQYNNSDSYAMSVALLAERIADRPAVMGKWPSKLVMMQERDRVRLQTLLREQKFYDAKIDGRFGPLARDAIHRFQVKAGLMPADGFASPKVLEALEKMR